VPVRAPDRRRRGDSGVSEQSFLDDPGVDVVAAADDEILGAAGEVDEAVCVDAAEVPVFSQPSWTLSPRLTRGPPAPGSVT
jgi:hypothetical protein